MRKLEANEVATHLAEFGRRTMLDGGNPYRGRAYLTAAQNLTMLPESLESIVKAGTLRDIPGVGEAIADIIEKIHETGTHPKLERMRADLPASVLDMLSIPGLRPEKVMKLHRELGIRTIDELEAAARVAKLRTVKGLGAAFERKVIEGIQIRRDTLNARHIHRAAMLVEDAQQNLLRSKLGLKRIEAAGDFRRGNELVSDLTLVAEAPTRKAEELKLGDLKIRLTDREHFGIEMLRATGSKAHLDQLQTLAEKKGFDLGPKGLTKNGIVIAAKTEKAIYQALGLQYIEPELREGQDEIALARKKRLPKLVRDGDIRGILHAHTNASDGVASLAEMADATRKRGYSYLGITDHSKSAHYAGGLTLDEINAQHQEIDRLNSAYGGTFRIFKGIESDILSDGSLDYPDHVLQRFDFIVASVHGQFRKDRDAQTERILRAVANPFTTILGHMTGRQLLRRPGYEIDVERILSACSKHGVAVEINANPWRLDLDWRWHRKALELGCMLSIDPDAHSTSEIDLTHWGVVMARKGGVPANRVLSCLSLKKIEAFLSSRKRRSF